MSNPGEWETGFKTPARKEFHALALRFGGKFHGPTVEHLSISEQDYYRMMEHVAAELDARINTPEMEDFVEGVKREAAHQVQRWGYAHDRSKSAENWFWLVGYLAGKALRSAITGDRQKAQHHTISSAAALFNWHTAITHDSTGAGIGQDTDLRATNPKDAQAAEDAA